VRIAVEGIPESVICLLLARPVAVLCFHCLLWIFQVAARLSAGSPCFEPIQPYPQDFCRSSTIPGPLTQPRFDPAIDIVSHHSSAARPDQQGWEFQAQVSPVPLAGFGVNGLRRHIENPCKLMHANESFSLSSALMSLHGFSMCRRSPFTPKPARGTGET